MEFIHSVRKIIIIVNLCGVYLIIRSINMAQWCVIYFLMCFATTVVICSEIGHQGRILRGQNAQPGQFPYQASICRINRVNFCGGAILNRNWVLTSARCLERALPRNLLVVVGAHRTFGDGITHHVSSYVNNPDYNAQTLQNNLALINTNTSILFNANVRPITLPRQDIPDSGVSAILSGWGNVQDLSMPGRFRRPDVLQFREFSTLSNEECRRRHGTLHTRIFPSSVCTDAPARTGICTWDDGNPLVANGEIIGVVAWAIPCGTGTPDVYTRVFSFINWIISTIN